MAFVQTIEVETSNVDAIRDHVSGWHDEQKGVAPGYQGTRILEDHEAQGRYVIEVDFSSREEAARNDERPETVAWAQKLQELVEGEPRFANYTLVCETNEGRK